MPTTGAVALGDSLKANCTLTDVSLASNHVNDAAAVGLAEMLTSNQTLTALELGRIANTPPEVTAVTLSPSTVYTNDTITATVSTSEMPAPSHGARPSRR